jgi:hypothetical protein
MALLITIKRYTALLVAHDANDADYHQASAEALETMVTLHDGLSDLCSEELDLCIWPLRDAANRVRGLAGTDGVIEILRRIECLLGAELDRRG